MIHSQEALFIISASVSFIFFDISIFFLPVLNWELDIRPGKTEKYASEEFLARGFAVVKLSNTLYRELSTLSSV